MASRGGLISVSGFGGTSSVAHEKEVHDLFGGLSLEFGDPCDDNAFFGVISEIEVS